MIRKKNIILISISAIFLLFSFIQIKIVSAGLFCGGMGTDGLLPKTKIPNLQSAVLQDYGTRTLAIDELFGVSSYNYSKPFGTSEGSWLWRQENTAVKDNATNLSADAEKKLAEYGKNYKCRGLGIDGFHSYVLSSSMGITNTIGNTIKLMLSTLFDDAFICKDPDNPGNGCINLLKISGGTKDKSDKGIIGSLSTGLFSALAPLMFIFVGLYMAYMAFVKKQIRLGITSFIWAFVVFIIGIYTMTNPWNVARLPNRINSLISGCIVDAMNGGNCMSDSNTKAEVKDSFVDDVCKAQFYGNANPNANLQARINGLTCMVSKSFTMDRWAQQQFGLPFNALYTVDPPSDYDVYPADKLEGSPEDYCIGMYLSQSPAEIMKRPSKIQTGDSVKKICNIAVAYMANTTIGEYGNKATMGDIIATATKDDAMWAAFTGAGRETAGIFAILAALAAAVSFIPVTLFGHIYSLTGTLLMMFAPIFLLLGIEPSRGRKIFLGWLEAVLSNILKYFATTLLVLVMLIVFSTVISQMTGAMVFISSLILCATFIFYRKEIVNMIGVVNMGGQRMSNKLGEKLSSIGKGAKDTAMSVAGGAVGGAIASGKMGQGVMKGAVKGAGTGIGMQMRRGKGFVANTVRSGTKVTKDINKMKEKLKIADREELQTSRIEKQIDKSSEQFQQNMNDNLKGIEQTNKLMDVKDKRNNIDMMNAEVNNDKFKEQIKDYSNRNIDDTKTHEELDINFTKNISMIQEAKQLEQYQANNKDNGEQAKTKYIDDYMREQKQFMLDDYEELKNDKTLKDVDPIEKNTALQEFMINETKKLDELEKYLKDNIKTVQTENGKSSITNVDLERQVEIKENAYKNRRARVNEFKKRLNRQIDGEEY